MAYGQKYQATFATRADKNILLKIYQDGYVGSVITLQGVDVSLQYLPTSDDPFEPILSSQLNISLDFTDQLNNIIDFTNINDRYNYVELYINNVKNWAGFIISDNVQISYSTGNKILFFNATDGLAMLKYIPYEPQSTWSGINEAVELTRLIRTSLLKIELKDNLNYITMCSYYANGMSNRSVDSWRDTFAQTYINYRAFLKDENTFISAYDVLYNIAKSFGCRIFQAKGKWWIVSINEFADTNAYYTEYNGTTGLRVNNGDGNRINTSSIIEAFEDNTSGLYFINNSQFKILRKGFYKIIAEGDITVSKNYISNGNLELNDGTDATFWVRNASGGSSVTLQQNTTYDYYYFELVHVATPGADLCSVEIADYSRPYVSIYDSLKLSILINAPSTTAIIGNIEISIVGDSSTYYLNSSKEWVTTASSYAVYNPKTTGAAEAFTLDLTSAPFPINGRMSFKYTLGDGAVDFITLTNFVLQIKSTLSDYNLTGTITETEQYSNTVEFPIGTNGSADYYPSANGSLLLSNNTIATGWYRYGIDTPNAFATMAELMIQQYINIYGQNIINIDCELSSFYTGNTSYPTFDASKLLFADDTDPASINVSTKSYMLGNSTITYPSNQIQATLLQISNEEIECTRVNKYGNQSSSF
jgi:hypothetical protein